MPNTITKLPQTAFRFVFYFARQQWGKFSILLLTSLIWAINDTFFPYFLKQIVDTLQNYQGVPDQVYNALGGVLFLLVLFWVLNEFAARLQGITSIYTFPRFRANIREAVFDYVKSHSHEYFSNQLAGNIANKIADLPTSCQSIMEIICFQFSTTSIGATIVLIMMWQTHPVFALVLCAWLFLHMSFSFIFVMYGMDSWEAHSKAVTNLTGKIVDVFTNMMTVRLFARGKYETKYLRRYQTEEINKAKRAMWFLEWTRIGMGLSGLFLVFGMVFLLIHGWINHWVTLGDFTQIGMQVFWLMSWIWYVTYQMTIFTRETGTIRNALSLIRKEHDIPDKKGARPIVVKQGSIRFEDVTFSYNRKRNVFKKFNLTIPAGQKIGLVGFSGSGKSTFVNLILRFYDLQNGQILIDEQNIADVTQDSLHECIAMIPQDPTLFNRSLMENIRYGRLDATDEEVIEASKLAHCDEFINKLDEGYNTLVGERGIKLSGGQRQRIAIARAILKNAPILILDEATSSLDTVTEKLIQESLQGLMKNRTTIVIAHRLSTLTDMDRILVFQKGQIIEDGTKEDLLKKDGDFSRLWNMQTDGFIPRTKDFNAGKLL
ncbi:MAG TPA: ABC transporter ATP-binding protein [Gammaproteobacteria bacterium]|nr:ABC transporter ATP-binding protein [Gammaproteobacteria bacterium]